MRASVVNEQTTHATLAAAVLATILGLGAMVALSQPAAAYDDDVDVVCWDHDSGETECMDVDDLAAECEVADPEYTTEQCGGLLENRVPVGLTTKKKSRVPTWSRDDDNGGGGRDNDRGKEPSGNGGDRGGQKGPNG